MAVQKNKRTRSKRNIRRHNKKYKIKNISIEKNTGELHIRHHMSPNGLYKNFKIKKKYFCKK